MEEKIFYLHSVKRMINQMYWYNNRLLIPRRIRHIHPVKDKVDNRSNNSRRWELFASAARIHLRETLRQHKSLPRLLQLLPLPLRWEWIEYKKRIDRNNVIEKSPII